MAPKNSRGIRDLQPPAPQARIKASTCTFMYTHSCTHTLAHPAHADTQPQDTQIRGSPQPSDYCCRGKTTWNVTAKTTHAHGALCPRQPHSCPVKSSRSRGHALGWGPQLLPRRNKYTGDMRGVDCTLCTLPSPHTASDCAGTEEGGVSEVRWVGLGFEERKLWVSGQ